MRGSSSGLLKDQTSLGALDDCLEHEPLARSKTLAFSRDPGVSFRHIPRIPARRFPHLRCEREWRDAFATPAKKSTILRFAQYPPSLLPFFGPTTRNDHRARRGEDRWGVRGNPAIAKRLRRDERIVLGTAMRSTARMTIGSIRALSRLPNGRSRPLVGTPPRLSSPSNACRTPQTDASSRAWRGSPWDGRRACTGSSPDIERSGPSVWREPARVTSTSFASSRRPDCGSTRN